MPLTDEEKTKIAEEERFRAKVQHKEQSRKYGIGCLVLLILVIIVALLVGTGGNSKKKSTSSSTLDKSATVSPTPLSKEEAQKELDDFMALAKQSNLVKSYEFSESENVVYITSVWYTQDVSFKKDFLAKVAQLKKALTGYRFFEVHDTLSDEKVAEVTALTGELKVYK